MEEKVDSVENQGNDNEKILNNSTNKSIKNDFWNVIKKEEKIINGEITETTVYKENGLFLLLPNIISLLSIVISALTAIFILSNDEKRIKNEGEANRIEYEKELYILKVKTTQETFEVCGEIIEFINENENKLKREDIRIPKELISKFNHVYYSKIKVHFFENDSILNYSKEIKDILPDWTNKSELSLKASYNNLRTSINNDLKHKK